MYSGKDNTKSVGLPHSDISGSKPILGSPKLFAEYHVFHRLLLPRHPPDALFLLDSSMRMWNPKKSHTSCGPFAYHPQDSKFLLWTLCSFSALAWNILLYSHANTFKRPHILIFINILVHFLFTKFNNTLDLLPRNSCRSIPPIRVIAFWWR